MHHIGNTGATALATALMQNLTLETLNLSGKCFMFDSLVHWFKFSLGNNIKRDGAIALATSLRFNSTLRNLSISGT